MDGGADGRGDARTGERKARPAVFGQIGVGGGAVRRALLRRIDLVRLASSAFFWALSLRLGLAALSTSRELQGYVVSPDWGSRPGILSTMGAAGSNASAEEALRELLTPMNLSAYGSDNVMRTDLPGCNVSTVSDDTFVPIFVMARDRVSSLRISLESYERTFGSPHEIVVLDHDTAYPPMVKYLEELQGDAGNNVSVVSLLGDSWDEALDEASGIIERYLGERPGVGYYAFTDPDVAFVRTARDVLLFYVALLRSCPRYDVVGPGLQISDIPPRYARRLPDGMSVYERHSPFWTDVPGMATWNGVGYHVTGKPIDTTFAVYRRDMRFRRMNNGLRAYAPYSAVHVDWYDDSESPTEDKVFYKMRQSGVNNW